MSGAKQQSEGITVARVLRGLALSEGVVGLGIWATCLSCEKYLPSFEAECFGDPLDLTCGGCAAAFEDVAEPGELDARQA